MPHEIFISSSFRDLDLTHDLATRLNKFGLKVIKHTPIVRGRGEEHMKANIRGTLRRVDEVIVILTKNSVDSPWLLFEMGYATSLGKQVTPVIQGLEPEELPEIIRQMEYVKYADLDQYISKLQQRVEEPSKSAA